MTQEEILRQIRQEIYGMNYWYDVLWMAFFLGLLSFAWTYSILCSL